MGLGEGKKARAKSFRGKRGGRPRNFEGERRGGKGEVMGRKKETCPLSRGEGGGGGEPGFTSPFSLSSEREEKKGKKGKGK